MKILNPIVWLVKSQHANISTTAIPLFGNRTFPFQLSEINQDDDTLFKLLRDSYDHPLILEFNTSFTEYHARIITEFAENVKGVTIISHKWPPKPFLDSCMVMVHHTSNELKAIYDRKEAQNEQQ